MLFYNFKNYQEFKDLFGTPSHRKNKVLYAFISDKRVFKECMTLWKSFRRFIGEYSAKHSYKCAGERCINLTWIEQRIKDDSNGLYINIKSMKDLQGTLDSRVSFSHTYIENPSLGYYAYNTDEKILTLLDTIWYSRDYETDSMNGICEDHTLGFIRYHNLKNDGIFKMKAGKMYTHLIEESDFGHRYLNHTVINWYADELRMKWESAMGAKVPKHTLKIDKDFEFIYSSRNYAEGDFHSCMTNRGYHTFYEDCVECRAASIVDENGKILSRAVIYDNVKAYDYQHNLKATYRLCERQYAPDCNNLYMWALVNDLIAAGEIDGYKKIGADCHSPVAFYLNNGDPLPYVDNLEIACEIDHDSTISYQDSFKALDYGSQILHNNDNSYDYLLESTDGYLDDEDNDDENYDEYHDRYTSNGLVNVCYNGNWISCDEDDTEDFYYIERPNYRSGYYYCENCITCAECNTIVYEGDSYYSDLTEDYYCCESCLEEAEQSYKENNWYKSDYSGDYFEDENEMRIAVVYDDAEKGYKEIRIHESEIEEIGNLVYDEDEDTYYDLSRIKYLLENGTTKEAV